MEVRSTLGDRVPTADSLAFGVARVAQEEGAEIVLTGAGRGLRLTERTDLAFDWSNLAPLCEGCHGALKAREMRGEPTAPLFAKWQAARTDPYREG